MFKNGEVIMIKGKKQSSLGYFGQFGLAQRRKLELFFFKLMVKRTNGVEKDYSKKSSVKIYCS